MGTGASVPTDANGSWIDEATAKELAGEKWSKEAFDEAAEDGRLTKNQWEALVAAELSATGKGGNATANQPVKRQRRQRKRPGLTLGCTDAVDHNVSTELIWRHRHKPNDLHFQISRILDHLYMGSADISQNLEILQSRNITRVINCTEELPTHYPEVLKYIRIPVPDEQKSKIDQFFDESAAFIHELKPSADQEVPEACFVHCSAGISRSASIVLSYLIQHEEMTLVQAWKHTSERRPVVSPNVSFMEQLSQLEERVTGKTTIDPSKYERYADLEHFELKCVKDLSKTAPKGSHGSA
jgi:atypical dual specificity phosphatase